MKITVTLLVLVFALAACFHPAAFGGSLPACNPGLFTRNGNSIRMSLSTLGQHFNQRLQATHSDLQDLQLVAAGTNKLKVSGEKKGQPVSITGPLTPTRSGGLRLHASEIKKNGSPVKGMMDLFGKDLADVVNTNNTPSLSAQGDNLEINVDSLLGVAGHVTEVRLNASQIEMQFASPPCR